MTASTRAPSLLLNPAKYICTRCVYRNSLASLRWSSTEASSPPPLLIKIKADLKAAMRAKDAPRLAVLRGTISEINQLASGDRPVNSDMQILALLKKRKSATEEAAAEAKRVNRPDLQEKEEQQLAVIEEYASSISLMDVAAMRQVVRSEIETLRSSATQDQLKPGMVMKHLLADDGPLGGKALDKAKLAELVREELMSNHQNS
ncbi:uncharacterized protein A1O9_04511 [Exophiala aquamarina CBS 119918]|uniref:Altered inheritance of mitochondria protein 41 n=1 Tax=Exophiala aquamarina CBS 119918 TaxID=1182545 RepID=A0A072PVR7_9EURO|nr:uncharacterized protein A1O9_04511 [Exophiala aquamarina CBS 119918]KEF59665.1 hypothetical protein A1O9_04511 [Exophiala aquamarina CBS 119918]